MPSSQAKPQPFEPDDGGLPPALLTFFERPAGERPALLLVAGAGARASGWAARASAALAGSLAYLAYRVVLCDLSVEEPELHQLLETPNLEGMADIFLFGASLRRVATRTGSGIHFVPAGPAVADAADILEHPRWNRLLSGAAEAEATLLLYVPAGGSGLESLTRQVPAVVILATAEESDRVLADLPPGPPPVAVLGPQDARPLPTREQVEAGIPDFALADGEARRAGVFSSRRHRSAGPRIVIYLGLLLLVLAGGWLMARALGARTPGFGFLAAGGDAASEPSATAPAPATALERPLPFSVAIEAHQDLDVAQDRAGSLADAHEGVSFFVAPILVDEVVYYRVMAGPLPDSASAVTVMRALVAEGDKRAESAWDVRPTSLAFQLGEYGTPEAAAARQAELAGAGIPGYIVEIPYTHGPSRYRLYAGAYETAEQAGLLARLLREAGIESPLVERTGQPPA